MSLSRYPDLQGIYLAIPESPDDESIKPVLLALQWDLAKRLRNTKLVQTMLHDGWVISNYHLTGQSYCMVTFERPGHSDAFGNLLRTERGTYIDPIT